MIFLKGNLGKDLEKRYTMSGKPITNGLLVVNKWHPKDKPVTDEQKERETVFMPFTIWGEHEGKKGDSCFIYGELRQYVDKVCNKRHSTVDCTEIVIKGKKIASPETIKDQLNHVDDSTNDEEIPFS